MASKLNITVVEDHDALRAVTIEALRQQGQAALQDHRTALVAACRAEAVRGHARAAPAAREARRDARRFDRARRAGVGYPLEQPRAQVRADEARPTSDQRTPRRLTRPGHTPNGIALPLRKIF